MENKKTQLPENAHRELKPGEKYDTTTIYAFRVEEDDDEE